MHDPVQPLSGAASRYHSMVSIFLFIVCLLLWCCAAPRVECAKPCEAESSESVVVSSQLAPRFKCFDEASNGHAVGFRGLCDEACLAWLQTAQIWGLFRGCRDVGGKRVRMAEPCVDKAQT